MIEYDLWLALARISNKAKLDLLSVVNSTKELYEAIFDNYEEFTSEKLKLALKLAWDISYIKELKENLHKNNIEYVTINHKNYPYKLREIENSPYILFYKGNIEPLNENKKSIALVGARECTIYGREVAETISKELGEVDINLISGLARGIDSICHEIALKNKKFTCGVLGCGVDVIYPKSNSYLYEKIINQGCIISEFLPGTQPLSRNFPQRNRIISGLSDLVVVVEGTIKSGSLITARMAAEQGRDVVAVPGSIFSELSLGTNKLIKDGAIPYTDIEDLLFLIGIYKVKRNNNKAMTAEKNIDTNICKIIEILSDRPMHINEIVKLTNIDIKHLYELLFEMQINFGVKCIDMNFYVKF
ncbi:MAG: DNA-processing protein DprA [Clostridium sp.]